MFLRVSSKSKKKYNNLAKLRKVFLADPDVSDVTLEQDKKPELLLLSNYLIDNELKLSEDIHIKELCEGLITKIIANDKIDNTTKEVKDTIQNLDYLIKKYDVMEPKIIR